MIRLRSVTAAGGRVRLAMNASPIMTAPFRSPRSIPSIAVVSPQPGLPQESRRYASAATGLYPTPHVSRPFRRRSKRSDFNFLTSARMFRTPRRGASLETNRILYRKVLHRDVAYVKEHREQVRNALILGIHLLPVDVCVEAFLGKRGGRRRHAENRANWHRVIRKSRMFHSLTKDRLVVSAFAAFEHSDRFKDLLDGKLDRESGIQLSKEEASLVKASRPSWHMDTHTLYQLRRYLSGTKATLSPTTMCYIHFRNDSRVPHAWDHYRALLPVTRADLVEIKDKEGAKRLQAQTPHRRFDHVERVAALKQVIADEIRTTYHGNRAAALAAWGRHAKTSFSQMLREQRAIAKMLYVFYTTKEAMLFNSGHSNFLQRQRLRYMFDAAFGKVATNVHCRSIPPTFWAQVPASSPPSSSSHCRGRRRAITPGVGMPPGMRVMHRWSRVYQSIPNEHRVPFFGIPPRFVTRPTCGFQLFLRHYRLLVCGGVQGLATVRAARASWRTLSPMQRSVFDFPFPVSIAPTTVERLPFQRYLKEQTSLLNPPISRTGRRPKSFFREVVLRWKALPGAEKNRYDTDAEIRPMFPLVQPSILP